MLALLAGLFFLSQCTSKPEPAVKKTAQSQVAHTPWAKNAVIYEVNVRQFTPEGTFNALAGHLPRLKELGVDILWLMPVNPIGEKNRKGSLGSYYSVKDYRQINPEYGTMDDFKNLVNKVHALGMKVIIDWVPNHSSWDNPLTKSNPEYYMHDSTGHFVSPFDWTDVIRFDYTNPGLRHYMTGTMKWWLTETGIDGFRCDVAHMVPVDYWNELRASLDSIRLVFMLAEADQPFLHEKAFDMTYDWKLHHIMNQIAQGKECALDVQKHFAWVDSVYPGGSYLMQFTSNHDENSWNGSEFERMGAGAETFAVLAATVPDMLLIYSGQESAFNRRLRFFDKDTIDWDSYKLASFYHKLIELKKQDSALWNGLGENSLHFLPTGSDSSVVAFVRTNGKAKVLVLCNLSPRQQDISVHSGLLKGRYTELFSNEKNTFGRKLKRQLQPWQYLVFEETE